MRRYDTIFILDPDLSDEGRVPVFDRLKDLIPEQGGALLYMDEWGIRKLAYPIKKKPRGYYVRADYCGNGTVVDEMERFFRIDDRVLKYMTILTESDADAEGLQAEIAKAQSEAAEAALSAENAANKATAPVDGDDAVAEPTPDKAPESVEARAEEVTAEEPKTETTEETETHGTTTT